MNSFEIKPSSDTPVTLALDRLHLEISPAVGGAISAFEWRDQLRSRPILRESNKPLQRSLDACSFPLVPFVNRIRGGRFEYGGRTVILSPNMPGDPSPLHGQGWLNSWTVEESSSNFARLSYLHRRGEWPWDYEATEAFALDENGLEITLTCRNRSEEPMPCGLGQHPYFPCSGETRIDTVVTAAWTVDENVLPVAKVPADGQFDLKHRLVCGQGLDNGFDGWGGSARMTDPEWPFEVRLSSSEAHFFQLYSPPTGGIFVAEPVTHANAALNAPEEQWAELGLKVLQSGEAMSLTMRIDVTPR